MTPGASQSQQEWWKGLTTPQIYLERDLGDGLGSHDWKYFVFRGRVAIVQLDQDRHSDHRQSVFDRDMTFLNEPLYFTMGGGHPKPKNYASMLKVAEGIGAQFEFMRVDLYNVGGAIYLGELSVVPNAAFLPIQSERLDHMLGWIWEQRGFLGVPNSQDQSAVLNSLGALGAI